MVQLLTEGIVDELLAMYRADLPAKLRALNTEFNDNTKLSAPTDNSYYAGARALKDGTDYPRVFVLGDDWTPTQYSDHFTDASHQVTVIAGVKAADTRDLQRQMYRWGRALWEITVAHLVANPTGFQMLHGENAISMTFERPLLAEETTSPYYGQTVFVANYSKLERF